MAAIFDVSPIGITAVDPQGRFLEWNRAYERLTGYSADELSELRFDELSDPGCADENLAFMREMAAGTRDNFTLEKTYRRKQGDVIWVRLTGAAVRDDHGALLYVVGMIEDITPSRRMQEALRQSEERSRSILESLPVIAYRAQAEHPYRPIYVSAGARTLGYPLEEWFGPEHVWLSRMHQDDRPRVLEAAARARAVGGTHELEYRLMTPDGSERWFRDVGEIVPNDDGTLCWQGVMLDITERRNTVAALRSSEALFRSITESSADLITILDGGGRFTYVSPSAERVLGWSREEMIGTPLAAILHPDDARAMSNAIESLKQADGRQATLRYRMRAKNGAWRTFEGTGTSMLQDPTIAGIVGSSRDITEQLEAEQNLRFQAQVLNAVDQAVIASDIEGKIVYINRRAAALFGWDPEKVIGQDYVSLAYPLPTSEDRDRLHLVLEGRASATRERLLRRHDGSEFLAVLTASAYLDEHGKPAGVVAIVTDITERRQLEEQLRQAQKMEAIGQLAGGVAHDFNNILTVISGRAEFLRDSLPQTGEGAEDVGEILQASARGSRLTRQLLAFSRKQMLQPKLLELDRVVDDLAPMLNRLIGEDIELVIRPGAGQRHVHADPGQLEQVLVNLVVNARDAMPSGGVLVISTRVESLRHAASAIRDHQLVPGDYLVVAVSDTGVGIDPLVMPRIFEPFFTTKAPGQGTGLGLSTVYGIAKQSGGAVNVRSQVGRGTTFDIFFPAAPESPTSHSTPSAGVSALAGSETILLVEDSDPVRAITERVLRSQGYRVLTASTGPEALEVSRAHDGRIELLLTDVVMPRMSGRELSETILRERPSIRTLYMSGYTDDVIIRKGLSVPGAAFLEKPFTSAALAQRVRQLLDERVSSF